MSCIENTTSVDLTIDTGVLSADLVLDPDPANAAEVTADGLFVSGPNESGWFATGETWTYAGADAPVYTVTIIGDKTTKYEAGHRVKLTQTSAKYFIMVAVAYDSGTGLTTVTMYGGTDYTLANAAIVDPFYSGYKKPLGFPTDPNKWTVTFTDAADRTQASAVQNTWYNVGSNSITIPIGAWRTKWMAGARSSTASTFTQGTLSNVNNGASDSDLTAGIGAFNGGNAHGERTKVLDIAAKTVYYLNIRTTSADTPTIGFYGSSVEKTTVLCECAYL